MAKNLIINEMSAEDHNFFDALSDEKIDKSLLDRGLEFATKAHSGQMRKDKKTPYIVHPSRVVKVLQDVGVTDEDVLTAAYLHDVLEDTDSVIDDFPPRVQELVKELTKPTGTFDKDSWISGFAGKSYDAILVKMADRYDNLMDGMKTMGRKWTLKYLKGTDRLLEAARKSGINKKLTGERMYQKLKGLRDQLAAELRDDQQKPGGRRTDLREAETSVMPAPLHLVVGTKNGVSQKGRSITITLYRAAADNFVRVGTSFAEARSAAVAYQDNPGFGGPIMHTVTVAADKVLDLSDERDAWGRLATVIGRDIDPARYGHHFARALTADDSVAADIAAAGYDWVRFEDDYPEGAITWAPMSTSAADAAYDAIEEE